MNKSCFVCVYKGVNFVFDLALNSIHFNALIFRLLLKITVDWIRLEGALKPFLTFCERFFVLSPKSITGFGTPTIKIIQFEFILS